MCNAYGCYPKASQETVNENAQQRKKLDEARGAGKSASGMTATVTVSAEQDVAPGISITRTQGVGIDTEGNIAAIDTTSENLTIKADLGTSGSINLSAANGSVNDQAGTSYGGSVQDGMVAGGGSAGTNTAGEHVITGTVSLTTPGAGASATRSVTTVTPLKPVEPVKPSPNYDVCTAHPGGC